MTRDGFGRITGARWLKAAKATEEWREGDLVSADGEQQ
jgi:hypothetical protein